jgi:hypothetical protein
MADDVTLKGATATFEARANEKAGKLIQVVNLDIGDDTTESIVSASNPVPVALNAASLAALETTELGATSLAAFSPLATAARQDTIIAAVDGVETALAALATAVKQDTLIGHVDGIEASLASIDSEIQAIEGYFKAEDAAAASGDKGIPLLAMRQLADTTSTDNDGDYTLVKIDEEGRVKVATKPASYAATTGSITTNGGIVWLNCSRASNIVFSMVATSLVGHNTSFEVSNNTTNGSDGTWYQMQAIRTNANTIEIASGVLAATPVYGWEVSVNGWNAFRVRATAHTSGTAAYILQPGSYATEPIPGAQISGTQPVSGSVSSTPGTPQAAILNSAASTNGTVIKASAGIIYGGIITNRADSARFLKLHNSTTVTPGTTAVQLCIELPANSTTYIDPGLLGIRFTTGICVSVTGLEADNDTTAIGAGEVKYNISFI